MTQISKRLIALVLAGFIVLGTYAVEQKKTPVAAGAGVQKAAGGLETTLPVQGKANGSKDDPHKWWRGKYEGINREIKKMDGKIDVALVGDSITARWGGETWTKHWGSYKAVNMGIGGDQTQNVLWRLENGQLDGYKARLFIVMIGTNNLWDKNSNPDDVAAGVKAILDLIQSKQPQAKILLLSIFPTGDKPNPGREKRAAVNKLLPKLAGGSVHYMDIYDKFLQPDGTISKEVMPDSLHLGSKGYDIWVEAISDKVKELLGEAKPAKKS